MGIKLNMFEEKKYKVIKRINSGQQSKERGEVELDLSRRQINRLVNKYRKEGKAAFLHGNTNRKPATTISSKIKKRILTLYRTKYESFNVTHFVEKLTEDEDIKISYTTVHRLLLDHHLLSPKAFKQTKRKKRKELKKMEQTKVKLTKQEVKTLNEIDGVNPLKHILRDRERNILVNYSKWMHHNMIGLKTGITHTYMRLLMMPQVLSLVHILIKKRHWTHIMKSLDNFCLPTVSLTSY